MKLADFGKLIASLIIPQLAGIIGLVITASSITTWYRTLNHPHTTPPSALFGPVWTMLYLFMGLALFLVWKSHKHEYKRMAFVSFAVQLALNIGWSAIFFAGHDLGTAFVEILALIAAIIWNIYEFSRIKRSAAWLLAPYLAWVCFATILNYQFWMINR